MTFRNIADCPTVHQDLTSWEFNQSPYAVLEQWRERGPVLYNSFHDSYMATSYKECASVVGDLSSFDSQQSLDLFAGAFGGISMMGLDVPSEHAEVRGAWAPDFSRSALQAQVGQILGLIEPVVDTFVEQVRSGESVDAIPAMTRIIPTLVIARMLGVEDQMLGDFIVWSDAIAAGNAAWLEEGPASQATATAARDALAKLNSYLSEEIAARRRGRAPRSGTDLVSRMVFSDVSSKLDERELIANHALLVFADNETTAKFMATMVVTLAQDHDQRRLLVRDRSLVPHAIEEIHRWETLTQTFPRNATAEGCYLAGVQIPAKA